MNDVILGVAHYCESHGPQTIFMTAASRGAPPPPLVSPGGPHICPTCQTISREIGYYVSSSVGMEKNLSSSNDITPPLYFLSSTPSVGAADERLLKHVAVRATSIEGFRNTLRGSTVLEKGGPLLVGDQRHLGGRTLFAFTFCLKDSASRGHKRIYSLFILLRDHFWLLQCLNVINHFFKSTALKFQSKADKLFDPKAEHTNIKGLSELLGDEDLYLRLHIQFVRVLRALGQNFQDTIYFGRSLEDKHAPGVSNTPQPLESMLDHLESDTQRRVVHGLLLNNILVLQGCPLATLSLLIPTGRATVVENEDSENSTYLLLQEGKITLKGSIPSLPSPVPRLVIRAINILKKSILSQDLIRKKLLHLREEIFGLSKVMGSIFEDCRHEDKRLRTLLKSMNLAFSDKDILEVWSRIQQQ